MAFMQKIFFNDDSTFVKLAYANEQIDDRLKKMANTLCIKLFRMIVHMTLLILSDQNRDSFFSFSFFTPAFSSFPMRDITLPFK